MTTPNLAAPHVAAAQNQKEVTINDALDVLDNAMNRALAVDMADADVVLDAAAAHRHGLVVLTGALTAPRSLTLPPQHRRLAIRNATLGAQGIDAGYAGAGARVTVPPEATMLVQGDGVDLYGLGGGSGGSGAATFVGLTDTPPALGTAGQVLTINATGDALVWGDAATSAGTAAGAHRHWRVLILANNGDSSFTVAVGIELRDIDGVNLAGTATVTGSSAADSNTVAENAFAPWTAQSRGYWSTQNAAPFPHWVACEFGAPVDVRSMTLVGVREDTRMPQDFRLEWSDDGTTWETALEVAGETGWAIDGTDARVYALEVDTGATFLGLTDTPSAFGAAGQVLTVNATGDGIVWADVAPAAYDFGMTALDTPLADALLGKVVLPRAVTLPAEFAGAQGHVDTSPAAAFAIDVTRNDATIGTVTIDTGGGFAFSTSGGAAVALAAGDVIRFLAPGTADASVAGIALTLHGSLA